MLFNFFRLIRWPNLLIVALTQYLLQYLVLVPALWQAGLPPILDHGHFLLLVIDTILIAAGGYIINDLLDYDADQLNKPDRVFIGSFFSKKTATCLYILLILVGLAIAWYLACVVKEKKLVLIYPAAVVLLWLYSRYFKKMPLVGNIVVALFCAFVAGVVLFAEREAYSGISSTHPALAGNISLLFGGYLAFAFLSTLLREVVKDLEDVEGDRAHSVNTLPVVFGVKTARRWAICFGLVLLVALLFFSIWLFENRHWSGLGFCIIALLLPLAYALFLLKNAREKSDFTRLSNITKYVMLGGLILLILIWKF